MGGWVSKPIRPISSSPRFNGPSRSAVLHRVVTNVPPTVASDTNNWQESELGLVYDASCGASVSCLGHAYKERIWDAMEQSFMAVDYVATLAWTTAIEKELANELTDSTQGHLAKAVFYNSGSDAMEAAMKLAIQYYREKDEDQRLYFISREQSYHGATLGALALSGHKARRRYYEPYLTDKVHFIPSCNPARDREPGESDARYIERKAGELDDAFKKLGPEKVIAFVMEPVVGAAMGCVPCLIGYIRAMKAVCRKYGALIIFDEVMCGIGRTGKMHAWEHEGVAPDIQANGKALGAGAQPIASLMCSQEIVDVLGEGSGSFAHGHTYQGVTTPCAAALEVLKIIRDDNLIQNVKRQGALLERLLKKKLGNHPNVGDIPGRGLFYSLHLVQDKAGNEPFDPQLHITKKILAKGLERDYQIHLYPATGVVDGDKGDAIMICPPYNITEKQVRWLVGQVTKLVNDFFHELNNELKEKSGTSTPKL